MSASKLKNIIILVLVVMDLFLAALVIPRVISAAGTDGAATRQIEQLLLENGISAGQGVIPNSGAGTRGVEFQRSADAEQRAAEILLGSNAEKKDMGGGIVSYESGRGIGRIVRRRRTRFQYPRSYHCGGEIRPR